MSRHIGGAVGKVFMFCLGLLLSRRLHILQVLNAALTFLGRLLCAAIIQYMFGHG